MCKYEKKSIKKQIKSIWIICTVFIIITTLALIISYFQNLATSRPDVLFISIAACTLVSVACGLFCTWAINHESKNHDNINK